MTTVKELVGKISEVTKDNHSASKKDEVAVYQAMMNDKDYVVDVYHQTGEIEKYSPSKDARTALALGIQSAAHVSKEESIAMADQHTFSKEEAACQLRVSKEFIHTYLGTGRKLPLGGRELSNVSLSKKVVPERINRRPVTETDANGNTIHRSVPMDKPTPAHVSVAVQGSCPSWVK